MKRREFLKVSAALAAGAVPAAAPASAAPAATESRPHVVVATGDPAAATRKAVEALGGMAAFVRPGQKVVIKPNMSFPHPVERGTNTHPAVVATLALLCREAGAGRVLVLDHPFNNAERCLEESGIREACQLLDKGMVFGLSAAEHFAETTIPGAVEMHANRVMKEVLAADVLIAAPTAKSHSSAGVSLSMKGMMGLIHDRGVMHWKYDLDEAIVDLASLLRPKLCVVDAAYVLTSGGPSGPGEVQRADTVVASADMVAADAQTVSMFPWYGRRFQPRQVKHVRRAAERGLGRMDLENLRIATIAV